MDITEDTEVIELTACRFSIDWTYDSIHKVAFADIHGFELHWRCDSWHVVVVTKNKHTDGSLSTYELDHWVPNTQIRKLINHPKAKIRKILNYHNSNNFVSEVRYIFQS